MHQQRQKKMKKKTKTVGIKDLIASEQKNYWSHN